MGRVGVGDEIEWEGLGVEMDEDGNESEWVELELEMEVRVGREMLVNDSIGVRNGWKWK